jgi:brefeldin A-inhibited guanine nucleotide-exchange protein
MNEIFLPLLEMRQSSVKQKSILLGVMSRLCHDPQALVEVYLNYDCDRTSLDNIYERLINVVSRIGTTQFTTVTPAGPSGAEATSSRESTSGGGTLASMPPIPPPAGAPPPDPSLAMMPYEVRLKRQSLECLVFVLRSLVAWSGKGVAVPGSLATSSDMAPSESSASMHVNGTRTSEDTTLEPPSLASSYSGTSTPEPPPMTPADDPSRFENAKQRKTTLLEGIKKFNFKPKRVRAEHLSLDVFTQACRTGHRLPH